jgi:hypothetical protein
MRNFQVLSSNSTCSMCCGFAVQQVVQQILNKSANFRLFDKSTANPLHLDISRWCGFVVDSTTNPQEIETVEYGFRLVHNKSKSCTTNRKTVQQIHNFTTSRTTCSTAIYSKSNNWSLSFIEHASSIQKHCAVLIDWSKFEAVLL